MTETVEEVRLAFREGTSDKVYHAQLVRTEEGFTVRVAFGRREGNLTAGSKIESATEEEARRIYDSVVREKVGKGYKPEGVTASPTTTQPPSPRSAQAVLAAATAPGSLVPPPAMLAEGIGQADPRAYLKRLMASRAWHAEVKLDGMRIRVVVKDGRLVGMYPRGKVESSASRFPELHRPLLDALPREGLFVLDGEVGYLDVTGLKMDMSILQARARTNDRRIRLHAESFPMTFVPFDILHATPEGDVTRRTYEDRRRSLLRVVSPGPLVVVMDTAGDDLLGFYERVVAAGGEGLICKRIGHVYQPGVRSREWVKVKAPTYADSLHVVGLQQGEGARSTTFGAFILAREDEHGRLRYVCKAGSGLSNEDLVRVMDATPRLRLTTCPLVMVPKLDKPLLFWMDRGVMADVRYTEPTKLSPRFPVVEKVRFAEDP